MFCSTPLSNTRKLLCVRSSTSWPFESFTVTGVVTSCVLTAIEGPRGAVAAGVVLAGGGGCAGPELDCANTGAAASDSDRPPNANANFANRLMVISLPDLMPPGSPTLTCDVCQLRPG